MNNNNGYNSRLDNEETLRDYINEPEIIPYEERTLAARIENLLQDITTQMFEVNNSRTEVKSLTITNSARGIHMTVTTKKSVYVRKS